MLIPLLSRFSRKKRGSLWSQCTSAQSSKIQNKHFPTISALVEDFSRSQVLYFAGKLFKSSDIPQIVEFFLMFHKDKPIDWLLDHLLYVKVCNPEKDNVRTFVCLLKTVIRRESQLRCHVRELQRFHAEMWKRIVHFTTRCFAETLPKVCSGVPTALQTQLVSAHRHTLFAQGQSAKAEGANISCILCSLESKALRLGRVLIILHRLCRTKTSGRRRCIART